VLSAVQSSWNVAFSYHRNPEAAATVIKEATAIAPDRVCKGYRMDVSSSQDVTTVGDQIMDDFETMDAVINNAGITKNSLAFGMSDDDWNDVLSTNLSGPFYVIRHFLPTFLAARKGRFVSISSIASQGMSGQANYSASKAGLIGLSGAIAKEYAQKGITSNVVSPGFFDTDMTVHTMSPEIKSFWNQHCPAKRMGKLEELSAMVLFLASDTASFVNGQVIAVSGGLDWTP
jgi:NAD(P)-dependent dehydrogenase (short-subunit alcohol dehydrogenase family)